MQIVNRTHNSNYYDNGTPTTMPSGGAWQNYSKVWTTNPNTGSAWTWTEIDSLQIGIRLYDDGSGQPECTQVYAEVNYTSASVPPRIDTYQITDLGDPGTPINSITLRAVARASGSHDQRIQIIGRTNAANYYGSETTMTGNAGWETYSATWASNPDTGQIWTWQDIDALQIGVKLYNDSSSNATGEPQCTQVWADISYVVPDQKITASKWFVMPNVQDGFDYSSFRDVTELVKLISPQGNANYIVSDVSGNTSTEVSYAAWSLIMVYTSLSETPHQIFLYDTLLHANSNSASYFTIQGFEAPPNPNGHMTAFVGEGDLQYTGDFIAMNAPSSYHSHLRDIPNSYKLWDGITCNGNSVTVPSNVWNNKSQGIAADGIDIDQFTVTSPTIQGGDTSAEVELSTGTDQWNLIYLVLCFSSQYGGLTPNATGIISYSYESQ
jgi:hypothetical protein